MNNMETRHRSDVLRCVDNEGREHLVTQALEEARVWTAHGYWSDWGTKQELLMLGSLPLDRLDPQKLRIRSSGETLLQAEQPETPPPQT